jgi:hypothetical protein
MRGDDRLMVHPTRYPLPFGHFSLQAGILPLRRIDLLIYPIPPDKISCLYSARFNGSLRYFSLQAGGRTPTCTRSLTDGQGATGRRIMSQR